MAVTGLAIRFHWISEYPVGLEIYSSWPIIILAGVFYLVEFLADKIPWVDSIWDSIHTIIRPIGGAIIGLTSIGVGDPFLAVIGTILCGAVAFSSHAAKATNRLAVNLSPEPVSNWLVSIGEDILVLGATMIGLKLNRYWPAALATIIFITAFVLVVLTIIAPIFIRSIKFWFKARSASDRYDSFMAHQRGEAVLGGLFAPDDVEFPEVSDKLPTDYWSKLNTTSDGLLVSKSYAYRCRWAGKWRQGYLVFDGSAIYFVYRKLFRIHNLNLPVQDILGFRSLDANYYYLLEFKTESRAYSFAILQDRFKLKDQLISAISASIKKSSASGNNR